jgi:hypothetical protein
LRTLYNEARAQALKELYKSKDLDTTRPASIEADFEEVAASCGHFSFSLYDFGSELQNLLAILEDMKNQGEQAKVRSWKWLRFWRNDRSDNKLEDSTDIERAPLIGRSDRSSTPTDMHDMVLERDNSGPRSHTNKIKVGFVNRLLRLLKAMGRDDGELCVVPSACHLLTFYSTLCTEGWHWSFAVCPVCIYPIHTPILSTLARGMGPPLVHVSLQHDYRCVKYHRMGSIYRHISWGHPCCDSVVDVSRKPCRFSILRVAR